MFNIFGKKKKEETNFEKLERLKRETEKWQKKVEATCMIADTLDVKVNQMAKQLKAYN